MGTTLEPNCLHDESQMMLMILPSKLRFTGYPSCAGGASRPILSTDLISPVAVGRITMVPTAHIAANYAHVVTSTLVPVAEICA